ncbi:MAG: hypothetical protein ABIN25_03270, partial [Ginsengibacter sp.]
MQRTAHGNSKNNFKLQYIYKHMKKISLLLLLLPALQAHAQKQAPMNKEAAAFYNKTITGIKPLYKNYVTKTSTALRNRNINADSLRKATKANTLFSKMNKADIEGITLLILQAANV